jgi:hypothetical protein
MIVDRYTKTVLTVIAAALVALVIQEAAPKATAQSGMDCGRSSGFPCYITSREPLEVTTGMVPLEVATHRVPLKVVVQ